MAEVVGTVQRTQLQPPEERKEKLGPEASSDLSGMQALPKKHKNRKWGENIVYKSQHHRNFR